MAAILRSKQTWVFDLDNTLYPAECDLFSQIDARMTGFVSEQLSLEKEAARALQKQYYLEHGTTLKGMMVDHAVQPEQFLAHVHDIDYSGLPNDTRLKAALEKLPGQKYVFTNGSKGHAGNVTRQMGLQDVFDGMFGIEDAFYEPKPSRAAFDLFVQTFAVNPSEAVFFEDLTRNLEPAHAMGFGTVLVRSGKDWSHEPEGARPANADDRVPDHVHHVTDHLAEFLEQVMSV
ncbi:MAG: pyrimidine 5'-nucleotidase [Pseudomonadota bacterium]